MGYEYILVCDIKGANGDFEIKKEQFYFESILRVHETINILTELSSLFYDDTFEQTGYVSYVKNKDIKKKMIRLITALKCIGVQIQKRVGYDDYFIQEYFGFEIIRQHQLIRG